jgi:hypothetical protein
MKKQIKFKLDDPSSFISLTKDYFANAGFKILNETSNQISFVKGNTLHNIVTFNPLNWKTGVNVTLQNEMVVADFDINTIGQLVTAREDKLWNTFVENYKMSITGRTDFTTENNRHARETKSDSLKYLKWAIAGAVVFGIPFGFVAYITGIDILAPLGAAVGAISLMMFRVDRDKKKNIL